MWTLGGADDQHQTTRSSSSRMDVSDSLVVVNFNRLIGA